MGFTYLLEMILQKVEHSKSVLSVSSIYRFRMFHFLVLLYDYNMIYVMHPVSIYKNTKVYV